MLLKVERDIVEEEYREMGGFFSMKEHCTIIHGVILILILAGCSRSTDSYVSQLGSMNPLLRQVAEDSLLARKGDPKTVRKVARLLNSRKKASTLAAVHLLGEMRDTTAVEPLAREIRNPDYTIRLSVVISLGKIGGPSAAAAVVRAFDDTSKAVRQEAVNALGEIRSRAELSQVERMLRDPAAGVRASAYHALSRYKDVPGAGVKAADFTAAARDSFDVVRYVAVQALGWGWPDSTVAADLLIGALDDRTVMVRLEAIRSLEMIRCTAAVPRFKKIRKSVTIEEQQAISRAIKTITGEVYPRKRAGSRSSR